VPAGRVPTEMSLVGPFRRAGEQHHPILRPPSRLLQRDERGQVDHPDDRPAGGWRRPRGGGPPEAAIAVSTRQGQSTWRTIKPGPEPQVMSDVNPAGTVVEPWQM